MSVAALNSKWVKERLFTEQMSKRKIASHLAVFHGLGLVGAYDV